MSLLVALASVVLAALLGAAAWAGTTVLAAAVGLAVLCVALGWGTLLGLPSPRGTLAVILLSGWGATATALIAGSRSRPLGVFATLLAVSVLVAFLHEMSRGERREHLVESVTGTVSGQVIAVLGAGWVFLPATRPGVDAVFVAAAAAGVAALALALPLEPAVTAWASIGAGVAAGVGTAFAVAPTFLVGSLVLAGAVAGAVAGTAVLLRSQETASTPLGMVAASAAPVCAVGTVAFAVARLATG